MKLPITLSYYLGKQFLFGLGVVVGIISVIIFMIDTVELIRRSSGRDVPMTTLLELALLKLPNTLQDIIPFAVLLASIITYTKLTRNSELAVIRAAGVSVWQFLLPSAIICFSLGVFVITLFNPLSAIIHTRYEKIEAMSLKNGDNDNMYSLSSSGLWLREYRKNRNERTIIHAEHVSLDTHVMRNVVMFINKDERFSKRINAKTVELDNNKWLMEDAVVMSPYHSAKRFSNLEVNTSIGLDHLKESFSSPKAISFWKLPSFIKNLQKTGFSARNHTLHWHVLLVSPIMLCAMLLIGASFSLHPPRHGKTAFLIVSGIVVGFTIYYLTGLVSALGRSGGIPVMMAAWLPVMISLIIGVIALLHVENG